MKLEGFSGGVNVGLHFMQLYLCFISYTVCNYILSVLILFTLTEVVQI